MKTIVLNETLNRYCFLKFRTSLCIVYFESPSASHIKTGGIKWRMDPGVKEYFVLFVHAFVLWALCGAVMAMGQAMTTMENALIAHALAAPLIAAGVSAHYFYRFAYTGALKTALFFVGFVIFMDAFVVALFIQNSFDMFYSLLGTWIPFAFIFMATLFVGMKMKKQGK
ncbi:hypothetical protein KJ765_04480 [Candidatus Micrarchaeota archaeon]|nr:hypothetical protein [Candidatus Micrarchaeota archaeon]